MARKTTKQDSAPNPQVDEQQELLDQASPLAAAVAEAATTDIVEYQAHEAAIIDLEKRFSNVVFDVTTTAGMTDAKAVRKEIRDVRYALQNTTKDVLVPYQAAVKAAQARVNQVKDFGATLAERVLKVEDPVDGAIKAEEKRQKDEKERLEQIERERVEKIQGKIAHFRNVAATLASSSATDIAAMLERLKAALILPEDYAEFEGEASIARDNAIDQLETLHKGAVQREEAEAQLKAQREAFAKQQQELEELRRKNQEEEDRRAAEERQRLADQQAELDRQRKQLEDQQRQQRAREEQHQRDQEELARLRAQALTPAPAPVAAAAPAVAATAIDVAPLTEETPKPKPEAPEVAESQAAAGSPTAQEIVEVVAMSWDVSLDTAREWLRDTQF